MVKDYLKIREKLENFTTDSCPTYDKLNYEINDNELQKSLFTLDNGIPNAGTWTI